MGILELYIRSNVISLPDALSNDTWYNIVVTRQNRTAKIYVDNIEIASDNGFNEDILGDSYLIQLGATWIGEFDNFMLYSNTLTEGEISALWNAGAGNEDAGFAAITLATLVGSSTNFTLYHASDIGKDFGVEGDTEVHGNLYAGLIAATDFSNYVGFDAPAGLTTDTSWTLPDDDGDANEVFITDGSEILYWGGHDDLAGFDPNEHIDWTSTSENFNTSGTFDAGAISGPPMTSILAPIICAWRA